MTESEYLVKAVMDMNRCGHGKPSDRPQLAHAQLMALKEVYGVKFAPEPKKESQRLSIFKAGALALFKAIT